MNHYELLKIKPTASQKEIKKAYRILAKAYHPDTYKGDKAFAEDKMQEINHAYDILSDENARKAYDIAIGINSAAPINAARVYDDKNAAQSNPYKTYNDMTKNIKYHKNQAGTYYNSEGYARANYTPYSEEDFTYKRKKDKFISMNEFIYSKKWLYVLLLIVGGVILVLLFLHLSLKALGNSVHDFIRFDEFINIFF